MTEDRSEWTYADPTGADALAERAYTTERERIASLLREHLGADAAAKDASLAIAYCSDPRGGIAFDEREDADAWRAFLQGADAMLSNVRAMKGLRPEHAETLRRELQRAMNVIGWRLMAHRVPTRRGPGRSWHAVTVVAVCRALWLRWKGEKVPRSFGSEAEHPFLGFLEDALADFNVRAPKGEKISSPRAALDSWSKVSKMPELDFDFSE